MKNLASLPNKYPNVLARSLWFASFRNLRIFFSVKGFEPGAPAKFYRVVVIEGES